MPVANPIDEVPPATAASVTIGDHRGLARMLSPTETKSNPRFSAPIARLHHVVDTEFVTAENRGAVVDVDTETGAFVGRHVLD